MTVLHLNNNYVTLRNKTNIMFDYSSENPGNASGVGRV